MNERIGSPLTGDPILSFMRSRGSLKDDELLKHPPSPEHEAQENENYQDHNNPVQQDALLSHA
jgi:hypothetical protein